MEKRKVSASSAPLNVPLRKLMMKPKKEKIRRPPNAFMLFAKDHRKIVASQHPDLSNKEISSILGKMWKATADTIQQKYFENSKTISELHKKQHPGYVYSPREARLQKMYKKKKKDRMPYIAAVFGATDMNVLKDLIHEDETKERTDANEDTKTSPEYVPNNPEYFTQQSPDSSSEENPDLESSQYSPECECKQERSDEITTGMDKGTAPRKIGQRWSKALEGCECCNRDGLESEGRCIPPYLRHEDGTPHYFPNPFQCSYTRPPSSCNTSVHFPRSINSFCCGNQVPRPYPPTFHPYWSSSQMNPHCRPNTDCMYEDMKPFLYQSPYPPQELYRHPYGYFERPIAPSSRYTRQGCCTVTTGDQFRRIPSGFMYDNPEMRPYASMNDNISVSNVYPCNSTSETGIRLQTEKDLGDNSQRSTFFNGQQSETPEVSNFCSSECGSEAPPIDLTADSYKKNNEMHSLARNFEDKRNDHNEGHTTNLDPSNSSISQNENKGTKEYMNDTNRYNLAADTNSENVNIRVEGDTTTWMETRDPRYHEPLPHESTTASFIKRNTGINPLFTSHQYRNMISRPHQPIRNNLIRMPVEYLKNPPAENNYDSSIQDKGYAFNIRDNQNTHGSAAQGQMLEKDFEVSSSKMQKIESIDAVAISAARYSGQAVRAETGSPYFSSSEAMQTHISETNPINNNEKSCFHKMAIESENRLLSTDHMDLHRDEKHGNGNSDENLAESQQTHTTFY